MIDTAATARPGDVIEYRCESINVTSVERVGGVALISGIYVDGGAARLGIVEDTAVKFLHRVAR